MSKFGAFTRLLSQSAQALTRGDIRPEIISTSDEDGRADPVQPRADILTDRAEAFRQVMICRRADPRSSVAILADAGCGYNNPTALLNHGKNLPSDKILLALCKLYKIELKIKEERKINPTHYASLTDEDRIGPALIAPISSSLIREANAPGTKPVRNRAEAFRLVMEKRRADPRSSNTIVAEAGLNPRNPTALLNHGTQLPTDAVLLALCKHYGIDLRIKAQRTIDPKHYATLTPDELAGPAPMGTTNPRSGKIHKTKGSVRTTAPKVLPKLITSERAAAYKIMMEKRRADPRSSTEIAKLAGVPVGKGRLILHRSHLPSDSNLIKLCAFYSIPLDIEPRTYRIQKEWISVTKEDRKGPSPMSNEDSLKLALIARETSKKVDPVQQTDQDQETETIGAADEAVTYLQRLVEAAKSADMRVKDATQKTAIAEARVSAAEAKAREADERAHLAEARAVTAEEKLQRLQRVLEQA